MKVELHFQHTRALMKAGVWCFWKGYYIRRRELALTALFVAGLILVAILKGRDSWVGFFIIGIWGLSFWAWRLKVYFALLRNKMVAYERLNNGSSLLLLTDEKITLAGGYGRTELKWEQLKGIKTYNDVLLLLWGGVNFTILPLSQVSPEALSILQTRLESNKN